MMCIEFAAVVLRPSSRCWATKIDVSWIALIIVISIVAGLAMSAALQVAEWVSSQKSRCLISSLESNAEGDHDAWILLINGVVRG